MILTRFLVDILFHHRNGDGDRWGHYSQNKTTQLKPVGKAIALKYHLFEYANCVQVASA